MTKVNVSKSILSISSPGTHLKKGDPAYAANLSRYTNEYAADLKRRKPDQFGFWAALPLPYVEECLKEIPYALDELNADGVSVETNHDGYYLGDKLFEPVFDELNKRNATIFIHPTTPCLQSGIAATPLTQYPRPMFEFLFDTARAVINLFLSGTVSRCPNVRFIIPHAGGALPPLIKRFSLIPGLLKLNNTDPAISEEWVQDRLNKQFYFDLAGWPFPNQIKGLEPYVSIDQLLYGSDFPFTPLPAVEALAAEFNKYLPLVFENKEDQEKISNGNAKKLLARTNAGQ